MALLQEIYNETVEQRNTAIRIQNKMLGFMKGPEDLTLLGPIIKEQQKILDSVLEKTIIGKTTTGYHTKIIRRSRRHWWFFK